MRLGQVLADCSDRLNAGERLDLRQVIAQHPDLAPDLALAIESLRDVAPPSMASPPEEIGGFKILREIGRGGMGVVYEAWHNSLERHVALKVLLPGTLTSDQQVERFRREAKAAARLQHGNIVPVFEVGEAGGLHYYAMKLIAGENLSDFIDELARRRKGATGEDLRRTDSSWAHIRDDAGDLQERGGRGNQGLSTVATGAIRAEGDHPPRARPATHYHAAARIGLQAAGALAYAHQEGVLHRDIKPLNLLLDGAGTIWVADFGLAKMQDAEHITRTRDVVGTLAYMAPERFSGWSDQRSDVYSLGLVLYEMLTLQPAFADSSSTRLMSRVLHEEPLRPRKIDPHIPRDFETVVLKAIAKDPGERYQSAAQLAADLRALVEDRPILARRVSRAERGWRWARRNPAMATSSASAFVLLLALVVVLTEKVWQLETEIGNLQGFTVASSQDARKDPEVVLRFGVQESLDWAELSGLFKPFLDQIARDLARRTGKRVLIEARIFSGDYEASIRRLAEGKVDFVRCGPVSYVLARRQNPAIRLLVVELEDGDQQLAHDSYIFVRQDSDIDQVSQLRGKRVAFADPNSTSGTVYFKSELAAAGLTRLDVDYIHLDRHDAIIAAVVNRQCAAGCTRYSYFEKAEQRFGGELRTIRSRRVPNKPWVARAGLDEAVFAALQDSFVSFRREHPGSLELEELKVDGFLAATPHEYDPLDKVIEESEKFDRG
jgi:phosphate/phosphite/phosphonate ABC transporter binding protein